MGRSIGSVDILGEPIKVEVELRLGYRLMTAESTNDTSKQTGSRSIQRSLQLIHIVAQDLRVAWSRGNSKVTRQAKSSNKQEEWYQTKSWIKDRDKLLKQLHRTGSKIRSGESRVSKKES